MNPAGIEPALPLNRRSIGSLHHGSLGFVGEGQTLPTKFCARTKSGVRRAGEQATRFSAMRNAEPCGSQPATHRPCGANSTVRSHGGGSRTRVTRCEVTDVFTTSAFRRAAKAVRRKGPPSVAAVADRGGRGQRPRLQLSGKVSGGTIESRWPSLDSEVTKLFTTRISRPSVAAVPHPELSKDDSRQPRVSDLGYNGAAGFPGELVGSRWP